MTKKINIVESLKEQRAQLKRLLDSKLWISDTPKPTLNEMASQVAQMKSIIEELDRLIQTRRTEHYRE